MLNVTLLRYFQSYKIVLDNNGQPEKIMPSSSVSLG